MLVLGLWSRGDERSKARKATAHERNPEISRADLHNATAGFLTATAVGCDSRQERRRLPRQHATSDHGDRRPGPAGRVRPNTNPRPDRRAWTRGSNRSVKPGS